MMTNNSGLYCLAVYPFTGLEVIWIPLNFSRQILSGKQLPLVFYLINKNIGFFYVV